VALLDRGAALEGLAGVPTGQFLARPQFQTLSQALGKIEHRAPGDGGPPKESRWRQNLRKGWISIHRASHLVYGSVLAAWLALAAWGFVELLS
jgi:hypothetical protein